MSTGKKIIIIDDNTEHLRICKLIFTRRGYDVLTMFNSDRLLNIIETNMPDLIFIGENMPEIPGIEATIKSQPGQHHTQIIYFSVSDEIENAAKRSVAEEPAKKPYEIDVMLQLSTRFLSKTSQN